MNNLMPSVEISNKYHDLIVPIRRCVDEFPKEPRCAGNATVGNTCKNVWWRYMCENGRGEYPGRRRFDGMD